MKHAKWALKWCSDITEDVYNKIINKLHSSGYSFEEWCCIKSGYESFKHNRWMRAHRHHSKSDKYVIDNHSNMQTEISVSDILTASTTPIESYNYGDRVRVPTAYKRSDGRIVGKSNSNSFLVEHDAPFSGHNGTGTPLIWGVNPTTNRAWFYFTEELTHITTTDVVEQPANKSSFGWKIGDAVEMKDGGGACTVGLKKDRDVERGETGIVTGVDGGYTEVKMDVDGKYTTRCEIYKGEYMKLLNSRAVKTPSELGTSSLGYSIGQRVEMKDAGWAFPVDGLKGENTSCLKGERGVITNFSGKKTEVLRDSGKYIVRLEAFAWEKLKLITEEVRDSVPLEKNRFSVGDRIIGNIKANAHYCTSREGWIGTVKEVVGTDRVRVEGTGMSEGALPVLSECFNLYVEKKEKSVLETFSEGKRPEVKSEIGKFRWELHESKRAEETYIQEAIIIKEPKKGGLIIV